MKVTRKIEGWSFKGAIHVRFKDYGFLILPLTFIFNFGETPENGRDSGQKMSTPVTKSL